MIGCDTNVLIRAVMDDHPTEAKIAKQFLKKISTEKKLFVASYAILEMVWALKVKKRTRTEICNAISNLLDSAGVAIGQREAITSALEMYAKGKADFGDYLILAESRLHGAPSLATFDKEFSKDNKHAQNPKKFI